jgi:subtilisin family serine protease
MDYSKLAPSLAYAYDTYVESGREALAAQVDNQNLAGFVSTRDTAEPVRVVVILVCGLDTRFDDLTDTGIEFHDGGQRVRTALVPMDALERLADHPGVERISADEYVYPHMDIAASKVGLPEFRGRTGTSGKGVIIGVVDSGIDSAHPDFGDRVQRIWDQQAPNKAGVPYGAEYTGADRTKSQDTTGHGTHIAGIVAGAGTQYCGVAPEADLVIVKLNGRVTGVIDALSYLTRVAKQANKPLVVNLSFGIPGHPHDGTDEMSMAVDQIAGRGVIVCCSAGNDGSKPIHAQAEAGMTETMIPCNYGFYNNYKPFEVFGWYSGKDEIEIAFQGPSGKRTPFQGLTRQGQRPYTSYKLDGWDIILWNMLDTRNKDHYLCVQATPPEDATKEPSLWNLVLRGKKLTAGASHRVDVWCTTDVVYLAGPGASTTMTITSPGCAHKAITVGAYITRKKWTDITKLDWQYESYTENAMAPFSGQGPLRDGTTKPNVVAPGVFIISCLSSTSKQDPSDIIDTNHVIMEGNTGTSLASPFIAGVVALLLQQDPKLDSAEVLKKFAYGDIKHDPHIWGPGLIGLGQM